MEKIFGREKGMKLWEVIVILVLAIILHYVLEHMETAPGYSCPGHCTINHEHYPRGSEMDKPNNRITDVRLECEGWQYTTIHDRMP